MTGEYIVGTIDHLDPIEKADKIVKTHLYGETLIVAKDSNPVGTRGIVIDCLSQLSKEVCHYLNLYTNSVLNADPSAKGYIGKNRRVKPIRLRGVKCSGLFLSFEQLANIPDLQLKQLEDLEEGTQGNDLFGVPICKQYIPKSNNKGGNNQKSVKRELVPLFAEHFSTEHLSRNLSKIQNGDLIVITEKLHGTSGRAALLPTTAKQSWWRRLFKLSPKYRFVVGSRRVVKTVEGEEATDKNHFYDEDLWTAAADKFFKGKLHEGETVYFEIVGFTQSGETIMGSVGNEKLKPFVSKSEYNDFVNRYGEKTTFTYGCDAIAKPFHVFVYRITLTNEQGHSVDYNWEQLKRRCEQMNVNHVPQLAKLIYYEGMEFNGMPFAEFVTHIAEQPSKAFPHHLREGVCVRVDNDFQPLILKEKSYNFKVLEGIIKDTDNDEQQ